MVGDIEKPAEDISMHSLYELSQRTHDFTKNDSILEEEKKNLLQFKSNQIHTA